MQAKVYYDDNFVVAVTTAPNCIGRAADAGLTRNLEDTISSCLPGCRWFYITLIDDKMPFKIFIRHLNG